MHDTRDLTQRLAELLRREHGALADFLVALAEFDRERRWAELGYTSCFYFLHRELGLSKGAAFYRKTAAELIQRCPEVIEPLRDGRLCITSVVELAKVITPENRGEVVARFFHASKRKARAVAAELKPAEAAPLRDVITVLRPPFPATADRTAAVQAGRASGDVIRDQSVHPDEPEATRDPATSAEPAAAAQSAAPPPAAARDEVEPLTGDLRRLHTTVSRRFLDKLAAARDALSHAQPDATRWRAVERRRSTTFGCAASSTISSRRGRCSGRGGWSGGGLTLNAERRSDGEPGRRHRSPTRGGRPAARLRRCVGRKDLLAWVRDALVAAAPEHVTNLRVREVCAAVR